MKPLVLDRLPPGMLEREATHLHEVLPGPALIHLPGRRAEPLFVSVLLHGNEDTGWRAARALLKEYEGRELPRALSLFIGNVTAARYNQRFLKDQPDYNRVWTDTPAAAALPERGLTRFVVEAMRERRAFASVDIHNNTGINPHYACVRRLDHRFFHLATLFSRTVVYFRKPDGVQAEAFAGLCPAVTVECGQAGDPGGVRHAREYLHACLNLAELPRHPVPPHDIDLYHTVAIVKVPAETSFSFDTDDVDVRFVDDLDHLNFRELPPDTVLGRVRAGDLPIEVWDEHGRNVAERYLKVVGGEIRTVLPVMPSMLTRSVRAIRQDCLGYFMERPRALYEAASAP